MEDTDQGKTSGWAKGVQLVRDWLNNNKVFFEVFSWLILGVMGVMVSYASLRVSRIQAGIARAQVSPAFDIKDEQVYKQSKKRFTEEIVTIANNGYPLSEFSSNMISMYEVTKSTPPGGSTTAYFPVTYLCCEEVSQRSTATLGTYSQPDNNDDRARIDREFTALNEGSNSVRFSFRLINLLTLSYKDAIGDKHFRYFLVRPVDGAVEISEAQGKKLMATYTARLAELLDIKNVSASALAAKVQ